jgi:hypothetical protein
MPNPKHADLHPKSLKSLKPVLITVERNKQLVSTKLARVEIAPFRHMIRIYEDLAGISSTARVICEMGRGGGVGAQR